jgi:fumarate reductase flavoprotein subunit
VAFNVFDAPLLELARTFPDYLDAEKAGALRTAASLEELARLIGCDPVALRETLAAVAPQGADGFGRSFQRSLQPPYHAVKVTGALFHTQGGLDIDASCRVLHADGTPFANLLAAGGAARGVSGNAVWGYLSGNGLLSAVGGGWVAATTAAELLKH